MVENDGNSSKIDRDLAILERARRQHGHVARWQLLELGVSQGLIAGRLTAGIWVTVHAGVYCIGPRRNDPVSRAAAAVLACGRGAVLSHASAASLWGFLPPWSGPMEVTTAAKRARPGITTHRCQSLQRRDITRQYGIPTTSPARTVLDVAPRLPSKQLTRLVNDQLRAKHLRPAALQDILERNPLHRGTKLLTPFLETATSPTDSPFEDEFRAFCAKYGFPEPEINHPFNGRRLDAFFPAYNLIVELDGWDFHKDQQAFRDDRDRDTENLRYGLITIRITRDRLIDTPDHEAVRLAEIMEGRGPPWSRPDTA